MTDLPAQTLGALLSRLLETLDADVQEAYREDGLDYRPRYTPVMRALAELGPSPITQIARHAPLTHSAASQTVAQMIRAGLVESRPGKDARERVVSLTPAGVAIVPRLRRHWAATQRAAESLSGDLDTPLEPLLIAALEALAARPFRDRIAEARAALELEAGTPAPGHRRKAASPVPGV